MTQIITASKSLVYRRGIVRPSRVRRAAFRNLRKGLVGLWASPRVRGADEWFDSSGYGNHGTLIGMNPATAWVPSPYGWALEFNGELVDIPHKPLWNLTSPFSVTVRMRLLDNSGGIPYGVVTHKSNTSSNGWGLTINRSTQQVFLYFDGGTRFATGANAAFGTTWHTIVAVFDENGTSEYWFDGTLFNSADTSGLVISDTTNNLVINGFDAANNNNAQIEFVSIHDRRLQPGEIQKITTNPNALLQPRSRMPALPPVVGFVPYPFPRRTMTGGLAV